MRKSTCPSMRPRRQRQRRAAQVRAQETSAGQPTLDVLQIMGRGLLGGLLGVLIDALRPARSTSPSGKRPGHTS